MNREAYPPLDTLFEVRRTLENALEHNAASLVTDGSLTSIKRERMARNISLMAAKLEVLHIQIAERTKP